MFFSLPPFSILQRCSFFVSVITAGWRCSEFLSWVGSSLQRVGVTAIWVSWAWFVIPAVDIAAIWH